MTLLLGMPGANKSLPGTITGASMINDNLPRTPIDRILSTVDMRTKLILLAVLTGFAIWLSVSSLSDSAPREIDPQEKAEKVQEENSPLPTN